MLSPRPWNPFCSACCSCSVIVCCWCGLLWLYGLAVAAGCVAELLLTGGSQMENIGVGFLLCVPSDEQEPETGAQKGSRGRRIA